LRALAGRLQVVREEERTRIAREIHDILAQELTRLKIDLDWLRKHVSSAGATEESKSFTEKLDASIDLANTATVTVQKIAAELRPVVLDSLGLAAAIEWQAEEIQRRTGIQCDVIVTDDDFRMNHQAETNIFRIIQESLTNVVRHANATKVEIIMERNDNRLVLIVQDNGVGFDCGNLKDPNSLGLLGMRERALMMNGEFEIHGEPGKGTQVKAAFPLNEPGANPRNVL
jgi:signal transduction histidine kinase